MYTGNTRLSGASYGAFAVYPCVYREHSKDEYYGEHLDGLSLCIQGTRSWAIPQLCSSRFIPVYTGNTYFVIQCTEFISVYPCVYREHYRQLLTGLNTPGLSLCIQGTHVGDEVIFRNVRFIPVYTGNTLLASLTLLVYSVYPCVYREHTYAYNRAKRRFGLSLCIQGTLKT